ncbi:hypothetical protein [Streptomyces sp. NPDC058745]|uniref:hypothetical protein n=1 Tax=Streptomyces sp. NPDC058745 TaxID=3346621 RepID=UPI0036C5E969
MDWGDAPAWGALLLSAVAFIVSLKARGDGKRAADAAEQSATDGRRSADAAVRGVEIANTSLQLQLDSVRPRVELQIKRAGSGVYQVENVGRAPATGLALHADDEQDVHWDEPLGETLLPGDLRLLSFQAAGSPLRRLRFTWEGQAEPVVVPVP